MAARPANASIPPANPSIRPVDALIGPADASIRAGNASVSLDRGACLALLGTVSLGRLVFSYRALPDVLPVDFRLDGENVLLLLAGGSPAATASQDAVVAFEADDFIAGAGVPRTGWSVTVVGRVHEVLDPGQWLRAADLDTWAGNGPGRLHTVSTQRISGYHLVAVPQSPAPRVQSAG